MNSDRCFSAHRCAEQLAQRLLQSQGSLCTSNLESEERYDQDLRLLLSQQQLKQQGQLCKIQPGLLYQKIGALNL